MRHYKLLFLVAVLLLVGSLVVGCGGGDSPAPPPTSGVINGEDEPNGNGAVGAPESLAGSWIDFGGFVKLIESAEWITYDEKIQYIYDGSDTVNGIATEKASLTIMENGEMVEAMTMWVDRDGYMVQAVIDGQAVEEFELRYLQMFAIYPLMPFYASEDPSLMLEFTQTLEGKSIPGWNVLNRDRAKETFDGKSVNVYTLDVQTAEYWEDGVTMRFSFGDFGSFKMLLSWESLDGPEDDFFKTEKITFR